MRFTCRFAPEDENRRAEEIVISVTLSADEVRAIRALRRDGDEHWEVKSRAFALRRAYRQAPPDYAHIAGGIRQIHVH
jgi:hypothetical protein